MDLYREATLRPHVRGEHGVVGCDGRTAGPPRRVAAAGSPTGGSSRRRDPSVPWITGSSTVTGLEHVSGRSTRYPRLQARDKQPPASPLGVDQLLGGQAELRSQVSEVPLHGAGSDAKTGCRARDRSAALDERGQYMSCRGVASRSREPRSLPSLMRGASPQRRSTHRSPRWACRRL